jgi:lipopolysaccharide/colanic/teichoic acid biosynthesis glycosyltransferase
VIDGRTGILFQEQTCASLEAALRRLEGSIFDPARLRENAERFSVARFQRSLMEAVEKTVTASGRSLSEAPRVSPSFGDAAGAQGLHPSLTGIGGLAKRSVDILVSSCALAVLGLPLLAVALCIRLTSPGPALFFQWRLGHGGRTFRIVKLRTMVAGAEGDEKPRWAVDRDPRCTRLGNLLRRFGIDELPQLWNVLRGEMSLVGPRPERPEFHRLFSEQLPPFARRVEVRSGLTGLAQVRGWRGNTSVEERLRSDLEYIERWSVWKDIGILLVTPRTLWRRKQHPAVSPPVLNTR